MNPALRKIIKSDKLMDLRCFLYSSDWRIVEDVPFMPGIYIIWYWKNLKPVYIGETVNLYERFSDIGRTVNHSFRRHVVDAFFSETPSDRELSRFISTHFRISFISVKFGRKEAEEYLINHCRDNGYYLFNKEQARNYLTEI